MAQIDTTELKKQPRIKEFKDKSGKVVYRIETVVNPDDSFSVVEWYNKDGL